VAFADLDQYPLWSHFERLAATRGVHGPEDVVKLLMVGADVTMLCATPLKNGISHLQHIEEDLLEWMEKHKSVQQMKGSMS
jgi:dihydroorotate dehydrogenase (fumarate)